jgi:tetratricopeptide (TPR) repeat protein
MKRYRYTASLRVNNMSVESKSTNDAIFSQLEPLIESSLRNAHTCKMNGEYDAALRLYDEIIEKQPDNSRAWHSKGNVLDLMGVYSDAIQCYDTALECDPLNAELWYNKGVTLKKMGSHEDGVFHIRKGLSLSVGDI